MLAGVETTDRRTVVSGGCSGSLAQNDLSAKTLNIGATVNISVIHFPASVFEVAEIIANFSFDRKMKY